MIDIFENLHNRYVKYKISDNSLPFYENVILKSSDFSNNRINTEEVEIIQNVLYNYDAKHTIINIDSRGTPISYRNISLIVILPKGKISKLAYITRDKDDYYYIIDHNSMFGVFGSLYKFDQLDELLDNVKDIINC